MKTYEQILQYIDETLADRSEEPNEDERQTVASISWYAYREALIHLKDWMVEDGE